MTMRHLSSVWASSVLWRVITTTLVLGLVVVLATAAVMGAQISNRLFDARKDQVLADADRTLSSFALTVSAMDATDATAIQQFVQDEVSRIEQSGADSGRGITLLRSPQNTSDISLFDLVGFDRTAVTIQLRDQVQLTNRQFWQSTSSPVEQRQLPAIVVGRQISIPIAGTYEVYLLYDLGPEQRTLDAVQRVLLWGAIGLVLLVGAVVYVVTRQVVAPVREAAHAAELMAAGDLRARVPSRGRDELARLADSFNLMGDSLSDKIQRMADLSRVQRRFVADVSHELRTPLTTVRMAADVIYEARHDLEPAAQRSAELLEAQIERFGLLLEDLLEISRFDAGVAALNVENVDLVDVVEQVVDLMRPLAEKKGSTLHLLKSTGACGCEIDTRRIERILRNLLANAVERGEGEPITVTVAGRAGAVAVSVRDNGIGMKEEDCERVFDRFWRADPARARANSGGHGGTGLGLSIASEDARLHGGMLQVWGRPGRGADFRLTLPEQPGGALERSPLRLPDRGYALYLRDDVEYDDRDGTSLSSTRLDDGEDTP